MTRLSKTLLILILIIIFGWLSFVFIWDIPAPTKTIEKDIPIDRLKNK